MAIPQNKYVNPRTGKKSPTRLSGYIPIGASQTGQTTTPGAQTTTTTGGDVTQTTTGGGFTDVVTPGTTTQKSTWKPPPGARPDLTGYAKPKFARPSYDMPTLARAEMGDISDFAAPEWDEGAVSSLAQKKAAPGIRGLRSAYQMGAKQARGAAKRDTLRNLLAGYGTGLESIMSGAQREAVGEYGEQYSIEYNEAAVNWESGVREIYAQFDADKFANLNEFNAAIGQANQEFQQAFQAEELKYGLNVRMLQSQIDLAMESWFKSWEQIQTTETTPTTTERKYTDKTTTTKTKPQVITRKEKPTTTEKYAKSEEPLSGSGEPKKKPPETKKKKPPGFQWSSGSPTVNTGYPYANQPGRYSPSY